MWQSRSAAWMCCSNCAAPINMWQAFSETLAVVLAAILLSGCGVASQASKNEGQMHGTNDEVFLALPGHALGCEFAAQQRLTLPPPQEKAVMLDALIEVDAHKVQIALFYVGQRVGLLLWDGHSLHSELSSRRPDALLPRRVLNDMQLALWPHPVVQAALPSGWQVVEKIGGARQLLQDGRLHTSVTPIDAGAFEISYARAAWKLRVDSPGGMHPCETSVR